MRLILEEKFNRQVKNEFAYDFEVSEKGLCVIEVSGRAKSWLQNTLKLISFFKDDDLAVKIDGREFPKLSGKEGLFDGEAAWNGNKLKDLSQINLFFIYLETGQHTLRFVADQSPLLETVRIYQTTNDQNIVFEPIKNYQIENGNRRPIIVFILVDLALDGLKIQASAGQKQSDDDDLQLKINGERQINDTDRAHKYWYWCGRILKGQSKIFDKKLNLATDLHYIELWADNAPVVGEIVFKLMEQKSLKGEVGRVALYADITSEQESINLRVRPNTESEVLKQVSNHARIVITKKAVDGEPLFGDYLSDLWHEVLYQGSRGFVHSSLIEISGQERERIIEAIKTKAQELDIDEKLALNLAHCESKWLSFARSKTKNKGVYQLGERTIEDINKKYGGDISDPHDPYQNIDGGLKYLKHLLEIYSGAADYLTRVIAAWNTGSGNIPYAGSIDFKNYDPQIQEIVDCTLKENRGEKILQSLKFLILPLIVSIGLWTFFTSDDYKNLNARERYAALLAQREIDHLTEGENFAEINVTQAREKEIELGYLQTDIDGDGEFEKIIFNFYSPEPFVYYTNIYAFDGEKIIVDGSLRRAFVDDLTGDGIKEVIVTTLTGQLGITNIFFYKNGSLERIPIFYDENGSESKIAPLGTSYTISFEDLDNDGIKEIIHPIRNYGNEFIEPTYYYRWNGRGFILYDQKDIELKISPRG